MHKEVDRLSVYASLKADEDVRVAAEPGARSSWRRRWPPTLGEKTSWLTPEILAIGADKVKSFEAQSPELTRRFGFFLDNIAARRAAYAGRGGRRRDGGGRQRAGPARQHLQPAVQRRAAVPDA